MKVPGSTGCKIHAFKCRGTARIRELHSSAFESRLGSFLLPLENIWILHLGFGAGYDSFWTCISHLPWLHGFSDPAVAPGSISSECSLSSLPCHLRFCPPEPPLSSASGPLPWGGVHHHGRRFMALSDLPNLGEDRLFISLWALSARAQFT